MEVKDEEVRSRNTISPGNSVQLVVVHVEMLLQLLGAHEAPVALVTRPVLLLLPQH